jgi:hypothetical protein
MILEMFQVFKRLSLNDLTIYDSVNIAFAEEIPQPMLSFSKGVR